MKRRAVAKRMTHSFDLPRSNTALGKARATLGEWRGDGGRKREVAKMVATSAKATARPLGAQGGGRRPQGRSSRPSLAAGSWGSAETGAQQGGAMVSWRRGRATASSAPTLPFAEAPSKASSATQDSARRQQPRLWSSRRFNPLESSTTADPSPALRRPPPHLDSHDPLRLLRRHLGSSRSTSLEAWRPL
ncbi:hypothetical protein BCR35DRAFT_127417 [Leucosporidium creatinivorum]|uniref:Uncharacterized protein n=1 Tax=Leucosporidium creatinivorum TaxID=106004 RepID=A0A1Y2EVV8_9BASI|nr:hypothetical protein BCR35DRAFT_127417 [Leucosporidium creatinivorum]